jgi:hypothetical protein
MSTQPLKPFAFVLMPFDPKFDDVYRLGIQSVAAELGIIAERVDEQIFSETILERIYRQIHAADIIIADMTGRNPNVFYEVGYAHALNKLCTLLTQRTEDIPFDLRHHRHLIYDGSIQKLRKQLKAELIWLTNELHKKRTSTLTVTVKSITANLEAQDWWAHAEVDMKLDIHNKTERRSPEIEAIYLYTGPGWKYRIGQDECPSTDAEIEGIKMMRHFIRSPINRLSPDAWAQLRVTGRKQVWSKFSGQEKQESYKLKGVAKLEIATSEGNISQDLHLDVEATEIPF